MPEEKTTLALDMSSNEPKYYFVNLSTINGLNSISSTLNAFADLHYRYSNSWFKWEWYSRLWAGYQFLFNKSLIDDYKLGKIDTDEFTCQLLDIFYFLKDNAAVKNPIRLLKKTWNSIITWDQESKERLIFLMSLNRPVYFLSNSNELNLLEIRDLFNNSDTGREWNEPPANKKMDNPKPVKFSDKFYLVVSYVFGLFKDGTPGLISKLVDHFKKEGINLNDVLLVSQYKPDLKTAEKEGIRYMPADAFFNLRRKEDQQVQQRAQQAEEVPLNSSTPQVERRPSVITSPGLFNRAPASSNISAGDEEEPQLQSSSSKKIN